MSAGPAPLRDDAALDAALLALRAADPDRMVPLIAAVGRPVLRLRPPGFAGLAAIVVGQQLSTASTAAILGRLHAAVAPLGFEEYLATDPDRLRACGLSVAKIRTLRAVAEAERTGRPRLADMAERPVEEARQALLALPGIGPWTADVFLLFCLGHPDAWPAGDLALQEAARVLLGLAARPGAAELTTIGEAWRPHRGAVAYLLWGFYRLLTGRAPRVPPGPTA